MYVAFRPPMVLLRLSPELIDRILCNLDLKSLLNCQRVCKQLKYRIDNCGEVQYNMELEINGLEANTHNNWTSADCLKCLREYQSAWERLRWANEKQIPMRDGLWELYGGVLAQTDEEGTFYFLRLPSSIRNITEHSWEIKPDVENIGDFGMDPSQDLLVWITAPTPTSPALSLHLRTLSNAEKHPLARHDIIHYDQCPPNGRWFFSIRIMGDYIGLRAYRRQLAEDLDEFLHDTTDFFIWNWKEDKLELDISTKHTQSFAFVSDSHVVLADLYRNSGVDQHDETDGYLTIVDFRAASPSRGSLSDVRHSIKLRYPPIADATLWTEFEVSSEPTPGWTPGKDDRSPFFVAKENRIFTVSMKLLSPTREYAYEHFIPLTAFKKCINHLGTSAAQELEWSKWAPTDTRLTRTGAPSSNVWVCFAHGSRSIVGGLRHHFSFDTNVYDFNQLAIRKAKAMKKEFPETCERVDYPTSLRKRGWAGTVETSLPYMRYTKRLDVPPNPYFLMCTADHVVLVDARTPEKKQYRIYALDSEQ